MQVVVGRPERINWSTDLTESFDRLLQVKQEYFSYGPGIWRGWGVIGPGTPRLPSAHHDMMLPLSTHQRAMHSGRMRCIVLSTSPPTPLPRRQGLFDSCLTTPCMTQPRSTNPAVNESFFPSQFLPLIGPLSGSDFGWSETRFACGEVLHAT